MSEPAPFRGNSHRPLDKLAAWLAQHHEAALEPELPIVDPHHHLWDDTRQRYLLDEFLADVGGGHRIGATVFAECRAMYRRDGAPELRVVGETEFVRGVAAMSDSGRYGDTRVCAGIVGTASLALGAAVRPVLEAQMEAGGARFRGIRDPVQWDDSSIAHAPRRPPRFLLLDSTYRAGFRCLAELGLSYDAWLFHPQIPDLVDLADAFPNASIILDHIGAPLGAGPYAGRRAEVFVTWRGSMRELARRANVTVKVGGMGMPMLGFDFHLRDRPVGSVEIAAAWRPYVESCIEFFGVDRCMFESNFPVDKQSCGYTVLWNAFKRITAGYGAAEKAALYAGTARRVYRLPEIKGVENAG